MNAPKVFTIFDPAADGKTILTLNIARSLPVEVISLNSALVCRGMNIDTAKPTVEELVAVPHHLVDIISPLEGYSAADFVGGYARLVNEIHARGRYPLIVDGTMMYFHVLTEGLNDLLGADAAVRAQLQAEESGHGLTGLYRCLQEVDPITAGRLRTNGSQHIERALGVYLLTGKPLGRHFTEQKQAAPLLDLCTVTPIPEDRHLLHRRIEKRFLNMLEHGFLDEMHALRRDYSQLHTDMPSMRCVGYRWAWDYLVGETDYESFVEKGIIATRQFTKHQLTWLRKIPLAHALDPYTDSDYVQMALALT